MCIGNFVLEWFAKKLSLYIAPYLINEFQIGGHCGCCGKWIPNEIFWKYWAWGICKKCGRPTK